MAPGGEVHLPQLAAVIDGVDHIHQGLAAGVDVVRCKQIALT